MDGQDEQPGARIARLRNAKGYTQPQLARLAHVSLSLLSKVEVGARAASPALIGAVAHALGVDEREIEDPARPSEPSGGALAAIHSALARYDLPLPPAGPPRSAGQLRGAVEQVNALRAAGKYSRLAANLPAVLDELTYAAHSAAGRSREEAFHLLVLAYFAAHALSSKLGAAHLATLAEDRIVWASRQSGNPLLIALGNWTRCNTFLTSGGPAYQAGLDLLGATRRDLEPWMGTASVEVLSVYGALHLREAILAARAAQAELAWSHIDQARALVRRGAADTNPTSILTSGPVNSSIVTCAVAVELGDPAAALQHAERVHIPAAFPPVRAGHHYVDLARARLWQGQRDGALDALLTAERLAPAATRLHPDARDTLGTLLQLERGTREPLRALHERMKRAHPHP